MDEVLARLEMVLVDREQQGTGVQNAMQLHPVSRTRSNFPHRSTTLYSSYQSRRAGASDADQGCPRVSSSQSCRMQILPPIWRPLPGVRFDLRRLNAAEWEAVARHAVGVKVAAKSAIQIDERCRNAQKRNLRGLCAEKNLQRLSLTADRLDTGADTNKRILQTNSLAQHRARDWRALALTQVHHGSRLRERILKSKRKNFTNKLPLARH